jgi:hypothetical protein
MLNGEQLVEQGLGFVRSSTHFKIAIRYLSLAGMFALRAFSVGIPLWDMRRLCLHLK